MRCCGLPIDAPFSVNAVKHGVWNSHRDGCLWYIWNQTLSQHHSFIHRNCSSGPFLQFRWSVIDPLEPLFWVTAAWLIGLTEGSRYWLWDQHLWRKNFFSKPAHSCFITEDLNWVTAPNGQLSHMSLLYLLSQMVTLSEISYRSYWSHFLKSAYSAFIRSI